MNSGIYKIINKINEKIYVGSTLDFASRWVTHQYSSSKCRKLVNAFKKHGIENFELIPIENVDVAHLTKEQANELLKEKEQCYLDTLQPFDNQGYNIHRKSNGCYGTPHSQEFIKSVTGENNAGAKSINKYSKSGEFIKTYGCITTAANDNPPASVQTIIRCCKGKSITTGGFMWSYANSPAPIPRTRQAGKPVIQICKQTNTHLNIFPSIKEAAKMIGCWETDIVSVCKKHPHKHTAGGFKWNYVNE
jgi:group I intron endonuclease